MFIIGDNGQLLVGSVVPQCNFLLDVFTGRPARSADMPVLFLLNGPKMGFSPRRRHVAPINVKFGMNFTFIEFHVYRGKNVGIQSPKLSKFSNFGQKFVPQGRLV